MQTQTRPHANLLDSCAYISAAAVRPNRRESCSCIYASCHRHESAECANIYIRGMEAIGGGFTFVGGGAL